MKKILDLIDRLDLSLFDNKFNIIVSKDKKYSVSITENHSGFFGSYQTTENIGRIYIQIEYKAPCTKSKELKSWKGRKWYLSSHMTDDEIIKTCYVAFKSAVKHEIMEGFKVDGIVLFNPHINFEELLKISNKEITRK